MSDKKYFAPIPNRAWFDDRLRRIHLKVLGAIAMHARFGDNGLGCTLSSARLADKLGMIQNKVAIARRQLCDWGYLDEQPHPTHKQMKMHLVVFEHEADEGAIRGKTNTGADMRTPSEPIPDRVVEHAETDTQEGIHKKLPSKGREEIPENRRKESPVQQAPSSEGAASENQKPENLGGQLARIERAMKTVHTWPLAEAVDWLVPVRDGLYSLAEDYPSHEGCPIGGRAQRLADEAEYLLCELLEDAA